MHDPADRTSNIARTTDAATDMKTAARDGDENSTNCLPPIPHVVFSLLMPPDSEDDDIMMKAVTTHTNASDNDHNEQKNKTNMMTDDDHDKTNTTTNHHVTTNDADVNDDATNTDVKCNAMHPPPKPPYLDLLANKNNGPYNLKLISNPDEDKLCC